MGNTYKSPSINQRPPQITDSAFYSDIRFDADDSLPDYVGLHIQNGASTTDTEWKLYKFTYNGSNVTRIQVAYGSWDDRATYF